MAEEEKKKENKTDNLESKKTTKKQAKTSERAKLEDIEGIIVELGKKGVSPAKIGIILRDKHGVQKIKLLGTKITKVLDKNKIPYKNDKAIIEDKIAKINTHVSKNRQDKRANRELVKFVRLKKKIETYLDGKASA